MNRIKKLSFMQAYKTSKLNFGGIIPELFFLFIAFIIAYFIFMYIDITNTIDNSVLLTKAVFSGNFFDFYDYSIKNASTNFPANYEILAYIPFAVWNLPLAVGNMAFGFDYMHSTFALLWAKGIIVVFAVFTLYFIYKILRLCKISMEFSLLACYVFSTSIMFFWPSFLIVQIDLPALLLMLIGIYFYLKGNNKLFTLFFALSIPFKMFAIFLFIPLLLLKEKRIIHIAIKTVCVMIPQLLCKILFIGSEAYNFALSSQSNDGIKSLFNFTDIIGPRKLSLFIVAFFAVCVFCYIYKYDEKKTELKLSLPLYISALVYGCMMIFVQTRGYWIIYLAPFLIISIFISGRFMKLNLLLELLSGFCFFMWYSIAGGGAARDKNIVWRLLLYKFIEQPDNSKIKYGNIDYLFSAIGLDNYEYLFFTVFVCSLAAILILCCPLLLKKHVRDTSVDRGVIIIRPLVLLLIIFLYIYAYTATTNPVLYNNISKTNISSECDLLSDNTVSQDLNFDKNYKLNELKVVFDNSNPSRNNFCSVVIEINNTKTNENIFTKRVGCSMIADGDATLIKLNKLEVNAQDTYEIKFTAMNGVDQSIIGYKNSISLYRTNELNDKLHPAIENGLKKDYNLSIMIR